MPSEEPCVAIERAAQRLVEGDVDEDAEIEPVAQLRSLEEHAVEEEHRIGGCDRDGTRHPGV